MSPRQQIAESVLVAGAVAAFCVLLLALLP